MLKKDELRLPFSCLNRAGDHEPIFVLRAHDSLAPLVVHDWAARYKLHKTAQGEFDDRAQKKHAEALVLADAMNEWWGMQPKEAQRTDHIKERDAAGEHVDPFLGRREVNPTPAPHLAAFEHENERLFERANSLIRQLAELSVEIERAVLRR